MADRPENSPKGELALRLLERVAAINMTERYKQLLSPEWSDRLASWGHTGFNVHSRVRAKTRTEAERVSKYMIRPLLSLGWLCYQYAKETN